MTAVCYCIPPYARLLRNLRMRAFLPIEETSACNIPYIRIMYVRPYSLRVSPSD